MLFTSLEFLFGYLPLVFCLFFILANFSKKMSLLWLAIASLFFYGWWNPRFVLLLLASIVFNYLSGVYIGKFQGQKASKRILVFSICTNLVLLGYYKYFNFFIDTLNSFGVSLHQQKIILPLGISFFTFTQIAFLVDVYRGFVYEKRFNHYVLFVTYFPHLIAGPVLHHKQMMPQFSKPQIYKFNYESVALGISIFAIGFFKKIMIADFFGKYAEAYFAGDNPESVNTITTWIGVLSYTFQIYFDFSGYSDMAVGVSRLFGISLPINFNSPYKSTSIIEFWRRWHITLSNFLKDYLYIPMGGNRKGATRRYLNLFITMLLGGLWHGANWTFVIWGALHGTYLFINHLLRDKISLNLPPSFLVNFIKTGVTFLLVSIAWVFFRSDTAEFALKVLIQMFSFTSIGSNWSATFGELDSVNTFIAYASISSIVVWLFPNIYELLESRDYHLVFLKTYLENRLKEQISFVGFGAGFVAVIILTSIIFQFGPRSISPFLYFQF